MNPHEQVIFDGTPVNLALRFSREQVLAAADARLRAWSGAWQPVCT